MTVRIIPASKARVIVEDATVDLVCFGYLMQVLQDRRAAGRIKNYVEATFDANPGLADLGALLPLGTEVNLPEFVVQAGSDEVRRLWDE